MAELTVYEPWQLLGADVELFIRGKNVTPALAPFLTRIHYRDNIAGEADEFEFECENTDGRWQNEWYPAKGDVILPKFGRCDLPLLSAGEFEIDQIRFHGPPSTVTIRALSAGVQKAVRTREGRSYINTTLANIVGRIAKKHKLQIVGKIENVHIDHATQMMETDIAFLTRLASMYGYAFKITGNTLLDEKRTGGKLTFFKSTELANAKAVAMITPNDVASFDFTDQVKDVKRVSTVRAYDPDARIAHQDEDDNPIKDTTPGKHTSADAQRNVRRYGTPSMLNAQRKAEREKINDGRLSGNLTMTRGSQQLCSGLIVNLQGWHKLDGPFLIDRATHTMSREAGYVTELEIKRVQYDKPVPKR